MIICVMVFALGLILLTKVIIDCRRPIGKSINNYMSETHHPFSYNTVDYVASLMCQNWYMCTVDISAAYRTVHINPAHWTYQSINWIIDGIPTDLHDTRLCFGLRCAPYIFTQLSNFIIRCMYHREITTIANYLDDFILFGSSFEQCQFFQRVLIRLLCSLGFHISWHKCTSPSQTVRYLGIIFDSNRLELRLPLDKLQLLREELLYFRGKRRATRHQLQRLCGLVAHASKLVRGGRTFSRRLIDKLATLTDNRRVRLGPDFVLDIEWWLQFAYRFNGITKRVLFNSGDGICCYTDASLSGYGMCCGTDWQAGHFDGETPASVYTLADNHGHWQNYELERFPDKDRNINLFELIPVVLAVRRWGKFITNQHLICYSDNTQVQACVNKGVSINRSCMTLLREILYKCSCYHSLFAR